MMEKSNLNKKELSHQSEFTMDLGLLSKKEVAAILKVACCTVDRYVTKGLLEVKKLGTNEQSRCYFDKEEVLRFVSENIKIKSFKAIGKSMKIR
jgi:hypothetical protein